MAKCVSLSVPFTPHLCVVCFSLISLSLSDERKSDGESVFQFWFISVLVLSVSLGHTQVNTKISSPCFLSFSFSLCQIYDIVTHMGGEERVLVKWVFSSFSVSVVTTSETCVFLSVKEKKLF